MGSLTAGQITIVSSGNTVWLNPNTTLGLAIGGTAINSAPFRVAYTGAFTATDATVTGTINASAGSITGNLSVTGTLTMGTAGKITNGNSDYEITSNGIELFQKVSSGGDTENSESRMVVWANRAGSGSPNLIYRTAMVSYAQSSGTLGRAVDLTGFDETKYIRFSVRRKLSGAGAVQDFTIGVAAANNQFVTGSVAGDAVISVSNGILWINNSLNVTGNMNFTGNISMANNNITAKNLTAGEDLFARDLLIGPELGRAKITYNTATARTFTIPSVNNNVTFAFINQAQTFTQNQIFAYGNLRLQQNNGTNTVNLRYSGTVARTIDIPNPGANSKMFLTTGAEAYFSGNPSSGTITPDYYITYQEVGGNTYEIPAYRVP
jgi:hypothetical protein